MMDVSGLNKSYYNPPLLPKRDIRILPDASIELSTMIHQPSGQPRWFRIGCELLILKLTDYVQKNCIERAACLNGRLV